MAADKPFAVVGANSIPVVVAVNPDGTNISGGGGGGGGDASAANQVTGNNSLASIDGKLPSKGTAVMTGATPVTLATDDTLIGAKTETAPASDTASSGVNGRLQRIAQRLSSLIGLLPAALGAQLSAASLSVTQASDGVFAMGGKSVRVSANFTRPADTTQYAVGDIVANSGTAAAMAISGAARVNAGSALLRRLKLHKSTTGLTSASFRVHLFGTQPTPGANDNAAFSSNNVANYLGKVDITIDQAMSDGAAGFSDVTMGDINFVAGAASTTLYAIIEARGTYTPGNAEVFTLTAELIQD